jgi:hypothetical protein
MFKRVDIARELIRLRDKTRSGEDKLIFEATRILKKDLFTENKILENLRQYNSASELINEEDVDAGMIFTSAEIKSIAILYRLKFLESKIYKPEIPYEAVLKIKYLDDTFNKKLKFFRILATAESFRDKGLPAASVLFAKTNYDNYYLIHSWGTKLNWARRLKFWPLRYFENLFISLLVITCIITLSLPTRFISLDRHAGYWSGYRAAAFFHLLIFNMGVTAYFTFAFSKNFSSSIWNSERDFD